MIVFVDEMRRKSVVAVSYRFGTPFKGGLLRCCWWALTVAGINKLALDDVAGDGER